MTFTANIFLIGLLPWFVILYYFCGIKRQKVNARIILILIANTLFYIWGGVGSFLFLCLYALITYLLVIIDSKIHKKWTLAISIAILVLPLICIKYASFLINNINLVFKSNITISATIFPIGLSFFTFEAVSLLVDVYKRKTAKPNLLYTYLYLSFFVTITSGPIIRMEEFRQGINCQQNCTINCYRAVERIVIGLSKKVLVADKIAALANYYFDGVAVGNNYSVLGFWFGAIAYTLQIYYDFSGYSDIAIGIGALLGFNIKENFDKPYQASTISEFWKKWHISLTQWFKEYIYIPLGGNRCKAYRHLLNMLIVWLVTGIWHGADWTFILWGIGYFALLVVEKYTPLAKKISSTIIGHIYSLFFINLLWVLFRAENISTAWTFIKGMFGGGAGVIEEKAIRYIPFMFLASALCLPWNRWLSKCSEKKYFRIAKACVLIILAGLALCATINSTYAPYIYGNF